MTEFFYDVHIVLANRNSGMIEIFYHVQKVGARDFDDLLGFPRLIEGNIKWNALINLIKRKSTISSQSHKFLQWCSNKLFPYQFS